MPVKWSGKCLYIEISLFTDQLWVEMCYETLSPWNRWSYMLYQLIAYYTTNAAAGKTLWDYIGWTVIIFQNAAFLEVSVAQMIFLLMLAQMRL